MLEQRGAGVRRADGRRTNGRSSDGAGQVTSIQQTQTPCGANGQYALDRIAAGESAAAGQLLHDHVMASRERMHRAHEAAASFQPAFPGYAARERLNLLRLSGTDKRSHSAIFTGTHAACADGI